MATRAAVGRVAEGRVEVVTVAAEKTAAGSAAVGERKHSPKSSVVALQKKHARRRARPLGRGSTL